MPKTFSSQIESGLTRAGTWLLGFVWLFLVISGLGIAFTPSPHSRILGWILLVVAAVIFLALMDRWIRAFPALMAIGTLSSFICIFTGHMASSPNPVARPAAVGATLFFAGSTALGMTFTGRKLNLFDRMALLVFMVVFFWQALENRVSALPLAAALSALAAAWAYDRVRRRGHKHRSEPKLVSSATGTEK